MVSFFSKLNYSFGNEYWLSDLKALKLKREDRVVCVTGSGDRPLHLLLSNCKEVVSVDANIWQNQLLHLKMAAMRNLEFTEYLAFLGGTPHSKRKQILKKMAPYMDEGCYQFWKERALWIAKGILYRGTVERLCKNCSIFMQIARKEKVKELFSMNNLAQQKQFIEEEWGSFLGRLLFDVCLHPLVARFFIKDPPLCNQGQSIHPGKYLYGRIQEYLQRDLAKKSILFGLLCTGTVLPDAYPAYLTFNGVEQIRPRLKRLTVLTEDLIDYLEKMPPQSFDAFSLADIISYLPKTQYHRLLQAMIHAAKPGARFCMRQLMSDYSIPEPLEKTLLRNTELEKELEYEDTCFVYRYMAGIIEK